MSVQQAKLKYVTDAGKALISEQIEDNLLSFFSWGLLGAGYFSNVRLGQTGLTGGDNSKLHLTSDENYVDGTVWQSHRSQWVYESGIDYGTQPIAISGVWVNNTLYRNGTSGAYAFHVDYPNGRVIFDSAISTSSTVKVEFSIRTVQCETVDHPVFKNLLETSFDSAATQLDWAASGSYSTGEGRVQLPALFLEVVPRRSFSGRQLGGGTNVSTDVNFYLFANNSRDRGNLVDVVSCQYFKDLVFYNKDLVPPYLGANGSIYSGIIPYPTLVSDSTYYWNRAYIKNAVVSDISNITRGIFAGVAKLTVEIPVSQI